MGGLTLSVTSFRFSGNINRFASFTKTRKPERLMVYFFLYFEFLNHSTHTNRTTHSQQHTNFRLQHSSIEGSVGGFGWSCQFAHITSKVYRI
jgi:hypothetical protein